MIIDQHQAIKTLKLNQVFTHKNIRRCLVSLREIYKTLAGQVINK